MLFIALFFLLSLACGVHSLDEVHGLLESLRNKATENSEAFISELFNSEFSGAFKGEFVDTGVRTTRSASTLPLVFLHGMGDSCFNKGMKSLTEESGKYMGVYSVCIPTGDSRISDTLNGFFLDMDGSVDIFAAKVKADPNLANGFNCVGLSQGNNICRGYIERYNVPPVATHLSVHGPIVGVSSLPNCEPDGKRGNLCVNVADILAKAAYHPKVQDFLFQADYFRDPRSVNQTNYKTYAQIAQWNNEGNQLNSVIQENFGKTKRFACIKALADTVVVPREAEWWGAYDSDYKTVLTMKETAWYRDDTFGLQTADRAGKLFFNTTSGNHLEFSQEELYGWLDLYAL